MSEARSIRNAWKILVLQSRYSARQFFKYTMSRAAFLLFLVAFVMLLTATLPQLRVRIQGYRMNKDRVETLNLTGSVYEEVLDKNGKASLKPMPGAVVEIGGFRVSTNTSGKYELEFYSSTLVDIPIVLNHGGKEDFERVTFLPHSFAVQKDFILR